MTSIIHLLCIRYTEIIPPRSGPSQVKLNRMSASLRNARSQISTLHGRLEGLNLLNTDNVQAMVDRRVENITGVVNKLRSTCTTECALQNTPQCKPAFSKISLETFFTLFFECSSTSLPYFIFYSILPCPSKALSIFSAIYYVCVLLRPKTPLSAFSIVLYSILCYIYSIFPISKMSLFFSPPFMHYL